MRSQAPAFQTYANELLALTMGLSLEAVGAVHRLFLVMWGQSVDQCTTVDDDPMIARTVGTSIEAWKSLRQEIQHPGRPIFEEKNGRLISPYLRQEAAKQRKYRKSQSENGEKSAQRRLNHGSATVQPMHQPESNSSSSLSSPSLSSISTSASNKKKTKDVPPAVEHAFEEFWDLYPMRNGKKIGRPEALTKFRQADPDDHPLILMAVRNYGASEMIQKGIGVKDAHRRLRNGKESEPWRDWLTPEQPVKPQEVKNGKLQLHRVGFEERDYRQGIF